ncbi:cation diffusion facilitator family transporter [Actinobacillus indolicus]|nr:cation diffusion facilitator family transporter [Actinobacillus indolicus]
MPNKIMNFGYRRAETLVALVNGSTLVIIAIYIIIEAVGRLVNPSPIMSLPMIAVAILGLIMNIVVARIMLSSDQSNLNMKAAYLHVVADTLGSVAAILAGLGMYFFNWLWLDAVASAAVSIIIFRSGFNVCRTEIRLLMQGVPTNVDVAKVEQMLLEPKEIKSITRMQIWGLTEDEIYLSAQLCFAEDVDTETERQILYNLAKRFHEMDIHATLQNDLAVYFEQHGKAEIAHHH